MHKAIRILLRDHNNRMSKLIFFKVWYSKYKIELLWQILFKKTDVSKTFPSVYVQCLSLFFLSCDTHLQDGRELAQKVVCLKVVNQ